VDRLVDKAHELKFPALAITDHGAMHGVIDLYQAARGIAAFRYPGIRL
jgi:DNA polymerase-3 subunit alpha